MKSGIWLRLAILSLTMGSLSPAYGCRETAGRKPVTLPNCVGERATIILNRALRDSDPIHPLRIELINAGRQTNFALHGTRSCEGAAISPAGFRYTGTWSYTRIGDTMIQVRFSLRLSRESARDTRSAAASSVERDMLDHGP